MLIFPKRDEKFFAKKVRYGTSFLESPIRNEFFDFTKKVRYGTSFLEKKLVRYGTDFGFLKNVIYGKKMEKIG